jgi:hypothetical protein
MTSLQDIHPVAGSVDDTHIFYQEALDGGAKPHAVRVTAMRLSLVVGGKSSGREAHPPCFPPPQRAARCGTMQARVFRTHKETPIRPGRHRDGHCFQ